MAGVVDGALQALVMHRVAVPADVSVCGCDSIRGGVVSVSGEVRGALQAVDCASGVALPASVSVFGGVCVLCRCDHNFVISRWLNLKPHSYGCARRAQVMHTAVR